MKQFNALLLGGAKRVSLGRHLIESGKRLGLEVHLYTYELYKEVPIAKYAEVIVGKRWRDPLIYDDLVSIIDNYQIGVVLPFEDPSIEIVSRLKAMRPNVFMPVSDASINSIMFDKKDSESWFIAHNIPIPKSYQVGDKLDYPVFIKPRDGAGSKGIKLIEDQETWDKVENKENYVIQQYIGNNKEYTVDCYVSQKGMIISIVPRERLVTAGGEVVNTITLHDSEIEILSERILKEGNFIGPITIQFIRNMENGKTYVMEINPRLGGGVIASIEAGADMTEFIIRESQGDILAPVRNWKEKTLMTRYFEEVIFYADNN